MLHHLRRVLRSPRLVAAAGVGFAAAGALAAPGSAQAPPPPQAAAPPQAWHSEDAAKLPTFTKAEVEKHASLDAGVWIIFRGGVYDITRFIANHPGGVDKILTAAGGSVEPFWSLYRQHLQPAAGAGAPPVPKDHVTEILAPLQVGWLDPAEAAAAAAARSDDDPYRDEPERHPALRLLSVTPCSAETPAQFMGDSYLTPNALWYVRNHHPVPRLDAASFTLTVQSDGGERTTTYTLEQLRALPRHSVTASMQCGGNRRGELNEVCRTRDLVWLGLT
jgi:sulfite oxidase